MSKKNLTIVGIVAVVAIAFIWGIGVNNKLVTEEENVSKAWSQVENVYKRRMDLIPQLVNTVQGAANYEKSVLTEVTNARAGVQEATVDPSTLSEEQIKAYQQAQDKLSKAVANTIKVTVERYPELLARVRREGHAVGNHTYHHLKGFKTCTHAYLQDVQQANAILQTHLFRPPHGRMKYSQKKALRLAGQTIYLWDVLTHDYNPCYSVEKMLSVVKRYTRNGSIIVMHDSLKSKDRMLKVLPLVIQWLHAEGYKCETLP